MTISKLIVTLVKLWFQHGNLDIYFPISDTVGQILQPKNIFVRGFVSLPRRMRPPHFDPKPYIVIGLGMKHD